MTPRLRYEKLRMEHAAKVFKDLQDPGLYTYNDDKRYEQLTDLEARYSFLSKGSPRPDEEIWLNWLMFKQDDNTPVGTLQATIMRKEKSAFIGYVVFSAYWQQGYGSEGVSWLLHELGQMTEVKQVLASIDSRNEASIRLVKRLGFQIKETQITDGIADVIFAKHMDGPG